MEKPWFCRRQRAQHDRQIFRPPVAGGEQQRRLARPCGQIAQAAPLREVGGEGGGPAAVDPTGVGSTGCVGNAVAEPDRGVAAGQRERLEPGQSGAPVDRPRFWLQCFDRRPGVGGADRAQRRWRGFPAGWGGGDEDDLAILAFGLGQQIMKRRLPGRPIARRCPAVVDDEDDGSASAEVPLRVQQRVRRREDDQRRERHAHQDQPQRGPRRCLVARHQPEQ